MKETRAGKCGRNLALVLNYFTSFLPDKTYMTKFKKEFEKFYSGVSELIDMDTINPEKPEDAAKTIKEFMQLWYQRDTQKIGHETLMKYLEK